MAAGNAKALRALVVVTLVSFLLMQGVAGRFDCCFCNCYNACKRIPGRTKDHCHWHCFRNPDCSFSCKDACVRHSSNDVGVAIASGGGSLGMVNGTGAGGAVVAAGGGSLGIVNGTTGDGEGVSP